jgi:ferritin-like metal-binding protein YciE
MASATTLLSPTFTTIRGQLRQLRDTHAERKSLERELASYTSANDLNDLEAILDRHSDEDTADIRRFLASRRVA